MKKILIVTAVVLAFAGSMFAAGWTNYEDYMGAKAAKNKAVEAAANGDTTTAVAEYKKAADLAGKSGTVESRAWRLNDAGYTLINEFKKITAYQEKIDSLGTMKPSKDKIQAQAEIAYVFNANIAMLEEAKAILLEGKALYPAQEKKETVAADGVTPAAEEAPKKAGPEEKIDSNLGFVDWVLKFTADNYKEGVMPAEKKEEPAAEAKEAPAK
jgi:hypothetical protein